MDCEELCFGEMVTELECDTVECNIREASEEREITITKMMTILTMTKVESRSVSQVKVWKRKVMK